MNKFLMTVLAAAVPVAVAMAAPPTDNTGSSPIASDSAKQKATPPVKGGGLLNTDVTPQQGKRVARQTNRQVAKGEITPDKNSDH